MTDLYVDIDTRPVLPQALRAAERYSLDLYIVTRDYLSADANVHLILAQEDQPNPGFWIAANICHGDICVTGDIGLATSCTLRGAHSLSPAGRLWGDRSIHPSALPATPNPRAFAQRLEAVIIAGRAANRLALASWRGAAHIELGVAMPGPVLRRASSG
jgi:uncharacterized protein YaiI (UPF0178 family)